MSQITKQALASSLRKLLEEKPLDKITVVDVAEDCGVNRQTFYYHFRDIYDLVDWFFAAETTRALEGKETYDTWQEGFLRIFAWVQENRTLVVNAYRSVSREQVEQYLYQVTYRLLYGVVEERAAGMAVRQEDKEFIAHFYKYGFVGLMLDWIRGGLKGDPERIVSRLDLMIRGDIPQALERYRTDTSDVKHQS